MNTLARTDMSDVQSVWIADDHVIEVSNLRKSFSGRPILNSVSFSVLRGEFVVLLGPSGGGKSTLFRCLTRLAEPDSGQIKINGTTVSSLGSQALSDFRRQVGFIFQQFNLVKRMTAVDNVLAARLAHTSLLRVLVRRFSKDDRQLALACLDSVGLLDQAYQRAESLSGGQQQRVAIARAFAQGGSLLLADEPISSLDPEASENVLQILQDAARNRGMTVMCSLHQVDFALRYADRIVALKDGEVFFNGKPSDFDPSVREELYRGNKA
ncbi:phosphonate ABC transporter ATP-binding protein [Roseibium aestuarii]|uniref:Phosphonate ABC transporter ATP-binding protein n=1 Tax=Roseibium aestuarii TaxID=2600299 RepID=A0ABW4JU53_9HYPH|nr:phosphonate ABC transporter ATP-binding protein [Roseibium aestuarii]